MMAARTLALAAAAACAAAGAALSALPEDSLRQTMVSRCLPLFPQFLNPAGGDATPAARTAPGRYLLDAGGAASFAAATDGPACFVGHPGVPEPVARRYVEDMLREWFPTRWSRSAAADGTPAWVVSGQQGATLEITVTSHGATGETPGSGVGFAVR